MDQFYILSLKHSPGPNGEAIWWRPAAAGYTPNLDDAGLYSLETVESDEGYYNNGETTAAWYAGPVQAKSHRIVAYKKVSPAGLDMRKETPAVLGYRQEPERDEPALHDVSRRWDGGLHNRPGDERNPEEL